jgi:hypothetical protein
VERIKKWDMPRRGTTSFTKSAETAAAASITT